MKHFLFLLIMVSPSTIASEIAEILHITGEAFDVKNQTLLYREQHLIDGKHHTVSYSDKEGKLFAEKKLHYGSSFSTPEYQLQDQRFTRETGSRLNNKQWLMYRIEKSGIRDELPLVNPGNLVIDAGFNNFIRMNFEELDSGKTLYFNFGLTDPLTELAMKIEKIDCHQYQPELDNKNNICLRAVTSNSLFRWFVPTIYTVYSRDTRFLMRYEGPSNLPSNNDSGQTVRINYFYNVKPTGDLS